MTENAIQIINTTDFSTLAQMADIATSSGYVKVNKAQAMFIMLKGTELGISPLQALDGINIIQGKPTISPALMLALINRSSELQDIKIDSQDNECVVTMIRKNRTAHTERFSMADAKKMGLDGKDNYLKQAKTMLKWRAVSACARIVFPDVIQGVYTPEEMGAETIETESGEVVITKDDAQPTTPPAVQIPATTPAVVVEEVKHGPDEWINGNIKAWGEKWAAKGLTTDQLKEALKISERWSDFKGTVSEADAAVEAYRKPVSLPPEVSAAKPKGEITGAYEVTDIDGFEKAMDAGFAAAKAGEDPMAAFMPGAVKASKPISEPEKHIPTDAELRLGTLARLEGESVTLFYAHKAMYVQGTGKQAGWKWIADAQILEADNSEPKIEVRLFPEDVDEIKRAGHVWPMTDAPINVPVILTIKENMIRIKPGSVETKSANPFGGKPETTFDDLPSANAQPVMPGMPVPVV